MPKIVKTTFDFEGRTEEREVIVEGEDIAPYERSRSFAYVGRPVPRIDGPERVSGRARYAADVQMPGMLHTAILRSPHPHARIVAIDARSAAALPGVRAILTHQNAPQISWYLGKSWLLDTVVRFEGEEVAVVAADTPDAAVEAARLIEVTYEPLPFVVDPEQALHPASPLVHPDGNLVGGEPEIYQRGDVEHGLHEAGVTASLVVRTPVALHNSMEPHGAVAVWDGDRLTIYESTQHIFGVRARVAGVLGLPLANVRVIKQFMGGGFGSKNGAGRYTIFAALLSKMTGRPVRVMLDRRAENLAAGNRSSSVQRLTVGATRDGTLVAIDLDAITGVGAYAGGVMPVGGPARELYRCPNVRTVERGAYTNTGPMSAFRAPGYVEGTVALELAMDGLAERLGLDPLELRRRNDAAGDQPSGRPYSIKQLDRAYEIGAERVGWHRRAEMPGTGRIRRGLGMASQIWGGAGGPPAYAWVRVNPDGTVEVITGTQDIGTGVRTALAQIAAEEFGIPIERVTVHLGDTENPYSPLSAGSMTLASVGPAVRMAAADAREQVLEIAASMLEANPKDVRVRDGEIHVAGSPDRTVSWNAVAEKIGNFTIMGKGFRGPNPGDVKMATFGAQFAEVEVDVETGEVRVLRVVAVHECGRVINPLTLGSQIEGGIIQGLGFALTEQRLVDPATGAVVNANLEEYRIPTSLDLPQIEHVMLEDPDPAVNNLGAKGIGEPPIIPTAAAIANAVSHALGLRVTDLPLTRDRVLALVKRGGSA